MERNAVIELQRLLQYYVPYTLVVEHAAGGGDFEHLALVGNVRSNLLIVPLVEMESFPEPSDS